MDSRDRILMRVKTNQPGQSVHQENKIAPIGYENVVEKFKATLISIGGTVVEINDVDEINNYILEKFTDVKEIISSFPEIKTNLLNADYQDKPHVLQNIELAILKGEFGVAENAAIWITQKNMLDRALPFICENLILVIEKQSIVPTLHEAYEMISKLEYQYGIFIAGPSKTADIEQSLVLGAHGAKTLSVFILHK